LNGIAVVVLALVLGAFSSCNGSGAKHFLEGSLSTMMDLGYDEARFESTGEDFAVRFIRKKSEAQEDTPLKVTYALLDELPFEVPILSFDLTEDRPGGESQRAVLSRNVLNDPRNLFPRIQRGTLKFSKVPTPDSRVSGELNATFENGTDPSSGTTVFGKFEAIVPP
jgi:hypothetical protein